MSRVALVGAPRIGHMMAMIAASEAMPARSETLSLEAASRCGFGKYRSGSGSQNPTRQPKARKAYYTVDSPEVKRMSKNQ